MTYVYRHFNQYGTLLYVGISSNLLGRLSAHKRAIWFRSVAVIALERYETRAMAREVEQTIIRTESPIFNKNGFGQETNIAERIRKVFSSWGRSGGSSKSPAKVKAARANAAKATAARLKKNGKARR